MGGWNIILYLSFTSFRVSIIYVDTGFVEMKDLLDTIIQWKRAYSSVIGHDTLDHMCALAHLSMHL